LYDVLMRADASPVVELNRAYRRALALAKQEPERRFLERRLRELDSAM
jgi:predicted RNA polymerase sigma factor